MRKKRKYTRRKAVEKRAYKSNPKVIVGKMSKTRASNNILWMKILDIALEVDPKRTKKVIRGIYKHDSRVVHFWERILKGT